LQEAESFLKTQTEQLSKRADEKDDPAQKALASFCQILLGSNEFLYVD
jgi:hypothetical protein